MKSIQMVPNLSILSYHGKLLACGPTFWLQEAWDAQGVVGRPEGLLQVLAGGPQQGPPHVHQTGVDGLDDGQEGQATGPALPKVLHRDTIPTGWRGNTQQEIVGKS